MNSVITDIATKRRDKLGIIAEILDVARGGTLKTQIMYRANLSFVQLTEYLGYMLKTSLIIKLDVNTKDVYVTTEKGLDFLQRHSGYSHTPGLRSIPWLSQIFLPLGYYSL